MYWRAHYWSNVANTGRMWGQLAKLRSQSELTHTAELGGGPGNGMGRMRKHGEGTEV